MAAATPTPGFVDAEIGGQTIRSYCQGTGSPTVIIEQGGGISLEAVFSWERPRTSFDVAADLHACSAPRTSHLLMCSPASRWAE